MNFSSDKRALDDWTYCFSLEFLDRVEQKEEKPEFTDIEDLENWDWQSMDDYEAAREVLQKKEAEERIGKVLSHVQKKSTQTLYPSFCFFRVANFFSVSVL